MFSNQVMQMTPGEALLEAPIPELVEQMAKSIASAQLALDAMGVRVAAMLSETKVDFRDSDGNVTSRSLLELGFTPTFYQFTETEIEVKMTVALKVETGFSGQFDVGVGNRASGSGDGGAGGALSNLAGNAGMLNHISAFGAALSLEGHHKYGFDMTGASTVKTVMRAVPAPAVFLEAIKEHARSGGTIASNGDGGAGSGSSGGNGGVQTDADIDTEDGDE